MVRTLVMVRGFMTRRGIRFEQQIAGVFGRSGFEQHITGRSGDSLNRLFSTPKKICSFPYVQISAPRVFAEHGISPQRQAAVHPFIR